MQGRRLESIARGNKTYSYTYNAEGIRTSKTVNGVKREYILNGTQILGEIWSDGTAIIYIYDAEGYAVGMLYRDSSYAANKFDAFFYERNLQGDVIAVYDCEDTKLVSYTYDAWGNVSITYSNGGDLVGTQYNPFTYRGYYRDSETGFYYLNTRYYDAVTGRFINADGIVAGNAGSLQGYNLYAYCFNNPLNLTDSEGNWPSLKKVLKAVAIVAAVVAVVAVCVIPATVAVIATTAGTTATLATTATVVASTTAVAAAGTAVACNQVSENVEEKEATIVESSPQNVYTYYHLTTPENAQKIMQTGIMKGKAWEGGQVFAWRQLPSEYAKEHSGAHLGVTISFKTKAPFYNDYGIDDPKVKKYGPVATMVPIMVWDVTIVEN